MTDRNEQPDGANDVDAINPESTPATPEAEPKRVEQNPGEKSETPTEHGNATTPSGTEPVPTFRTDMGESLPPQKPHGVV